MSQAGCRCKNYVKWFDVFHDGDCGLQSRVEELKRDNQNLKEALIEQAGEAISWMDAFVARDKAIDYHVEKQGKLREALEKTRTETTKGIGSEPLSRNEYVDLILSINAITGEALKDGEQ